MRLEVSAQVDVTQRAVNLSTEIEATMRDREAEMALRDTEKSDQIVDLTRKSYTTSENVE